MRLVTYLEALETAEEEPHADHFTVLPPRDGDVGDAESDLEDVPDDLEKEDGFEAAGKFEVDYGSDEESKSGYMDPNSEPSQYVQKYFPFFKVSLSLSRSLGPNSPSLYVFLLLSFQPCFLFFLSFSLPSPPSYSFCCYQSMSVLFSTSWHSRLLVVGHLLKDLPASAFNVSSLSPK